MFIYLRSGLFLFWFLSISLILNIGSLPLLVVPRRAAVRVANKWARLVLFGLKHIAGVDMVVRGRVPSLAGVLTARREFRIWGRIARPPLLRQPAIALKRELLWVPDRGTGPARRSSPK